MKWRKKPVVIDAMQYFSSTPMYDIVRNFAGLPEDSKVFMRQGECLMINTLEGTLLALPGDYIIKGVKGEFYSCKPDIFIMTYEEAE